MALDTGPSSSRFGNLTGGEPGSVPINDASHDPAALTARTSFTMADFDLAPTLGDGLRAAREFQGLTAVQVAEMTRVRRVYLVSIEGMRFGELPSRPFALGYVRAYAQALGLDETSVIERFRREVPDETGPLRAPSGLQPQSDPRVRLIAIVALVVFSAVLIWNVAQRALKEPSSPAPTVPDLAMAASGLPVSDQQLLGQSVVSLGEPLPAPAESTLPTAYVTPGLAEAAAAGGSVDRAQANAKALAAAQKAGGVTPLAPAATVPVRAAFNAHGTVYGAAPQQSVLTIQARKSSSIIIKGADGSVYFARQLAAGEAYRAPMVAGLTLDVSDPVAFDVYVNGEFTGKLPSALTPLSRLGNVPAASLAN
jgi:cytoskeletal protein RodZ